MKKNNSNKKEDINKAQNSNNLDCFWDDCIKEEPLLNNMLLKISSIKEKSNNNIKKNYKKKVYERRKSELVDTRYKKLCEKIPILYQEEQNNINKKKKIKNSIKRSLLLYSYGLEVQKANKTNISQNKINKEQEELKLCTWKPKLNNYKRNKTNKSLKNKIKISHDYKTNKNIDKNNENVENIYECTFRPKINNKTNNNLKKIFNKSKSISLYTDRENSSFILRYKKARDEYMIRRFKKLSEKDDSYNNFFIDLTSRVGDKQYKNYLNVNNNIQIYNKVLKKNKKNNSMIFNLSTGNNNYLTNKNCRKSVPNTNKSKKYYINLLKKQLRLIDLEIYN